MNNAKGIRFLLSFRAVRYNTYNTFDISIPLFIGLTVATDGLHEAHFAMARKDAVYFYSQDGRGQCYAIEGEKTNIFWYRTYLVIVTKETPAWTKTSTDMSKGREDKFILTIFDIQNKFIGNFLKFPF